MRHQFNSATFGIIEYWYDLIKASQLYWIIPALLFLGFILRKLPNTRGRAFNHWALVLGGAAVGIRAWVICSLPGMTPEYFRGEGGGINWFLFLQTMHDHLGAHVWNNTVKPPFLPLLYGSFLKVFSMETALRYNLLQIPPALLGIGATYAVYFSIKRLYLSSVLSFWIALIFTLLQLKLEFFPIPIRNPDVLTVALVAIWTWGLVGWMASDTRKSQILCGITSALLVLQQPFHFAVVPLTLLAVAALRYGRSRLFIKRSALLLAMPVTVALAICAKNYEVGRYFAPSNLGGLSQGNLFFAWTVAGENRPEAFRKLVEKSDVPEWYRWCAARIIDPKDENGKPKIWEGFAMPGGICAVELTVDNPESQCWPYDPRPLHSYLTNAGFDREAQVVARDIQNNCDGRHLLAGPYPTLSLGWFGYFGKISSRLIFQESLRRPYNTLRGMFNTHRDYSLTGPGFLGREKSRADFPGAKAVYWAATTAFELLLMGSYVLILLAPLFLIPKVRRRLPDSVQSNTLKLFYFGAVVSIFFHALIVCYMTAWDLDRYFSHITPVLLIVSPLWLLELVRLGKRGFKAQA